MSMIMEKRNEVAAKINNLISNRNMEIDAKVNAYRAQLESVPLSEEIIDLQKLLKALDEVISCEESLITKKEETKNIVETESIASTPEPIEESTTVTTDLIEEVKENDTTEEDNIVEVEVNPVNNEAEIVKPEMEARPGMVYVNIPERR